MAVTYKNYVFGTFLCSCASIILLVVCLVTQNWVEGKFSVLGNEFVGIQVGLFKGKQSRSSLSNDETLYMTCLYEFNICAYSCRKTENERKEELRRIHDGLSVGLFSCGALNTENQSPLSQEVVWFNSGVYVCTLLLISLSLFFAILSGLFGIYNVNGNPIEAIWGIFGLYIWNSCSAATSFLMVMMYGIHYAVRMKDRFSYAYLFDESVEDLKSSSVLSISYWLVFTSMVFHIMSILLLIKRDRLINSEPVTTTVNLEDSSGDIILY